jgi:hypothetical protein
MNFYMHFPLKLGTRGLHVTPLSNYDFSENTEESIWKFSHIYIYLKPEFIKSGTENSHKNVLVFCGFPKNQQGEGHALYRGSIKNLYP